MRLEPEQVKVWTTNATMMRWREMVALFSAVAVAGSRRSARYRGRSRRVAVHGQAFADAVEREWRLLVKEADRLGLDSASIRAQARVKRPRGGPAAARPMADPSRKRGESGEQSGLDDPRR